MSLLSVGSTQRGIASAAKGVFRVWKQSSGSMTSGLGLCRFATVLARSPDMPHAHGLSLTTASHARRTPVRRCPSGHRNRRPGPGQSRRAPFHRAAQLRGRLQRTSAAAANPRGASSRRPCAPSHSSRWPGPITCRPVPRTHASRTAASRSGRPGTYHWTRGLMGREFKTSDTRAAALCEVVMWVGSLANVLEWVPPAGSSS